MAHRRRRRPARRRAPARPNTPASSRSRPPVAMEDRWFPGPSRIRTRASHCRTDKALAGRPAAAGRRPARLRERRGRAERRADIFGLPEPPDDADRAGRPRPLDRRLPGARDPASRELLVPVYTGPRRGHTSTSRRSGSAKSSSRSAPASSGRPGAQHQDPHRHGRRATSTTATTGRRSAPTNGRPQALELPGPAEPDQASADFDRTNYPRMKAQVNNTANGWNDLVNSRLGGVGADRPDQDQGEFHARSGVAPGARLPPDGPDLDGQRLQRLHRELSRVPARRSLSQGADGLGPALERLPRHPPRGLGGELNGGRLLPDESAGEGPGRHGPQRPARGQSWARSARPA